MVSTVIESLLSVAAFVMVIATIAGAVSAGFANFYTTVAISQDSLEKSNERIRVAAAVIDGKLYIGFRNTGAKDVTITNIYNIYPWWYSRFWSGSITLPPGSHYILGPFFTSAPDRVVVQSARGVFTPAKVIYLSSGGGSIGSVTPTSPWGETFYIDVGFGDVVISTTGYLVAFATYSTRNPYTSDVFSSIQPISSVSRGRGDWIAVYTLSSSSWARHEGSVRISTSYYKAYGSGIPLGVSGTYSYLYVAACAGIAFETLPSFSTTLSVWGRSGPVYEVRGSSINVSAFDVIFLTRSIDPRLMFQEILSGYPAQTNIDVSKGGVVYVVQARCMKIWYEYPNPRPLSIRVGDFYDNYRVYSPNYLGFGLGVIMTQDIWGFSGNPQLVAPYPTISISYIPPQAIIEMILFS
jgi:hypothetical protein